MAKTPKMTKTAFLKTIPSDISAADAVKRAVAAGYKDVSLQHVYAVRTLMNREKGVTPKSARPAVEPTPPAPVRSSAREALVNAVLELGFQGVEAELALIKERMLRAARG